MPGRMKTAGFAAAVFVVVIVRVVDDETPGARERPERRNGHEMTEQSNSAHRVLQTPGTSVRNSERVREISPLLQAIREPPILRKRDASPSLIELLRAGRGAVLQ